MIPDTKLTHRLTADDIDVIVASSPQNVFYLSRLQSLSQHLLDERAFAVRTTEGDAPRIVLPGVDASIVVDMDIEYDDVYTYGSFYLYESEHTSDTDREVLSMLADNNYEDPITALVAALDSLTDGDAKIALERTPLTQEELTRIETEVEYSDIRDAGPICSDLRRVKTAEEVDRLRQSVEINQESIHATIDELDFGMTEQELAAIYERNLVQRGADPLFTVIGFGAHGAYPHARPGNREIQTGDLVRFDVGCTYDNYSSDIARTFAFQEATDKQITQYEILNGSLDRGIELLRPSASTTEVFEGTVQYVRDDDSGVFESFDRNHVGHGIGIDVYDAPTINQEPNLIEAGMVMCVEPPYYELGVGGIQVEDEVVVTEAGTERFSNCPDELSIINP